MRITTFFLVGAAWVLSHAAAAQAVAPAAPAAAPVSASHRQAAEALIDTFYSEDSFNTLIDNLITAQLKTHPEVKSYEPELRSFMNKYMSLKALKPDMVAVYAQDFTEAELREITRFYQTPTGQKAVTRLPAMMQRFMEIGQNTVKNHLPELEKAMKAKARTEKHE